MAKTEQKTCDERHTINSMLITNYERSTKMAIQFRVPCPCGCREMVEATDLSFSSATVTVDACSYSKEIDPAIVSLEVSKSRILELESIASEVCPTCGDTKLWCRVGA